MAESLAKKHLGAAVDAENTEAGFKQKLEKQKMMDQQTLFREKEVDNLQALIYGEGNDKRCTGVHETSSFTKFSYGAGNRAASFRIPTSTVAANGKGYIEDRRPASNIDAYIVGAVILSTACLNG